MLILVLLESLPFMFIILQALFREGHIPAQFDDISYLGMNIRSLDDDVVPAMVSLMKGMPNLNTLNLKSNHSIYIRQPDVRACLLSLYLCHTHLCAHKYITIFPCDISRISSEVHINLGWRKIKLLCCKKGYPYM